MSNRKETRDLRDYLDDIVGSMEDIWSFTNGMSYDDLESDKKTLYAVMSPSLRNSELIDEYLV